MSIRRTSIILICSFVSLTVWSQNWTWSKMEGGEISVLCPGEFEHRQMNIKTDVGEMIQHHYIYQDSLSLSENYFYHLSYYGYPEGSLSNDSTELTEDFLDLIIEGSVSDLGGELLYQGDLEVWGYPSRVWKIQIREGSAVVKNQVILYGDTVITLQVFTHNTMDKNGNIDQFLNSIKLSPKS